MTILLVSIPLMVVGLAIAVVPLVVAIVRDNRARDAALSSAGPARAPEGAPGRDVPEPFPAAASAPGRSETPEPEPEPELVSA